jgi:hypothetical protein
MEDLVYNSPEEFRERPITIPANHTVKVVDAEGREKLHRIESFADDHTDKSGRFARQLAYKTLDKDGTVLDEVTYPVTVSFAFKQSPKEVPGSNDL